MNDLTDAPSNCLEIDKTLGFGFGTRATQEMTIHREQKAPARGSLRLLIAGSGEPGLTIPGAHYDELHGGQMYATYSADTCAPVRYVDFDVQVVLPPGFAATTPRTQNINGRYDDRRYTFKFGVQSPP